MDIVPRGKESSAMATDVCGPAFGSLGSMASPPKIHRPSRMTRVIRQKVDEACRQQEVA